MSVWTQPSPSDWDRWEERLANQEEPATAARAVAPHLTSSAFKRNDRARHAAALEMSREARADEVDQRVETWSLADDASDSTKQFWAKRWNAAYAQTDKAKVEVSGGVSIIVESAFPADPAAVPGELEAS